MEKLSNCPLCGSTPIRQIMHTKDYFYTGEEFNLYQCENCEVIFTNPRPEAGSLGKYYNTKNYLSHNTKNNGFTGRIYSLLRKKNIRYKYKLISHLTPKGQILDIGSGTGELLDYFKKEGWTTRGIEPNKKAREFAVKNYNLTIGDENELERQEENSFDVITLWHVLEHIPKANERIEKVKRLLKSNGLLVIALPNPTSFDAIHYGAYWAGYDVPRHLFHFTPQAFVNFSKARGLKIIKTKPLKFDAYYVSYLSEKYKQNHPALLRATIPAWRSNLMANKTGNYSSLIYFLKKETPTGY